MTKTVIALDAITVVVRGQFNAAIFSPAWLLHQNLIGTNEFADAEVEIVTSEFALFRTGWLRCQVTPDTFQVSTSEPAEFERVRDVAIGVLSALRHTPVAALGINRETHFAARDLNHYHAVGDQLAPKQFWEELVKLPVTRQIVLWSQRPDEYGGRVQIDVEPSMRFQGHIFVSHNDHFNLQIVEHQPATRDEAWTVEAEQSNFLEPSADKIPTVKEILSSKWISSIERSNEVTKAIMRIK
ncbi:hypothetical protein [Mycobacterium sp. SMC-4]|uniref:hypothetical protein n=1 Tax=Mycobacterium sp. SMC-4 TaxID=2857059 RepID=UPI003CFC7859